MTPGSSRIRQSPERLTPVGTAAVFEINVGFDPQAAKSSKPMHSELVNRARIVNGLYQPIAVERVRYSIALIPERFIMRSLSRLLLLSMLTFALQSTVFAQSLDDLRNMTPEDRRAYLRSMSDDERSAMREKWHAEYEILSDDEKRAIRIERHEARLARSITMSAEERVALRERWRNRKGKRHRSHSNCHGSNNEPESD